MPLPWHTPCGRPADVQIRSWRICGVRVKMLKNKPAAAIGDRIFTLTPEMARV